MKPTLCSRCHKRMAVVFITKIENGKSYNEGLCLPCAREYGIKPVEDIMKKMGISEEELDTLTNDMMAAFNGAEDMDELSANQPNDDEDEKDDEDDRQPERRQFQGDICRKRLFQCFDEFHDLLLSALNSFQ